MTGSQGSEPPAVLWPQQGQLGVRGAGPGQARRYSRGVRWEAHAQEGVQEGRGAAALEFIEDFGIELGLACCHRFLLQTEASR